MRLAILAITLLFISPVVFAKEAENDLQCVIEEVRDTRTTGDWSRLEILTQMRGSLLKDAKRKRLQITQAEDNLGNDLKPESFNKYHIDFSSTGRSLPTIELASPPRKATHINIEGTLELFIPSLDQQAQIVFANLNEIIQKSMLPGSRNSSFAQLSHPLLQEYGISLRVRYNFFPSARTGRTHRIEVAILDNNKKYIGVSLVDNKGKEVLDQGGHYEVDRTSMNYYFYVDPAEIADLVFYLKSDKAIKTIPLEYKNIPLP